LLRTPRRELVWGPRPGRAHEQLASVRERDVPSVGSPRSVLGLIPVNNDLRSWQQRVLREAAPEQDVWCAGLERPVLESAVGLLHFHVKPHMWIDPLHACYGALELDRKSTRLNSSH